jgi:hypothetical protein
VKLDGIDISPSPSGKRLRPLRTHPNRVVIAAQEVDLMRQILFDRARDAGLEKLRRFRAVEIAVEISRVIENFDIPFRRRRARSGGATSPCRLSPIRKRVGRNQAPARLQPRTRSSVAYTTGCPSSWSARVTMSNYTCRPFPCLRVSNKTSVPRPTEVSGPGFPPRMRTCFGEVLTRLGQ